MAFPPTERVTDRYRLVWSDEEMGYHLYRRMDRWSTWLLTPLLRLAQKQNVRRISPRTLRHEEDAWAWLQEWCLRRHDWHGVGYARMMEGMLPGRGYVWLVDIITEPSWVYELYRPPRIV